MDRRGEGTVGFATKLKFAGNHADIPLPDPRFRDSARFYCYFIGAGDEPLRNILMPKPSLPILALSLLLSCSAMAQSTDSLATALFAGGSFWCLEPAFEGIPGVDSVVSGYTGGQGPNPDFESVSSGNSAYVQAVRVTYHPKRVPYAKLLDAYWKNIDPTRADGQFSDDGRQYRPIIFHFDEAQKTGAEASLKRLRKSKRFSKPILTEIVPASVFYAAEPEHQDYYRKHAARYKTYVKFSGRDAFLRKVWGAKAK